MEKFNEFDIVVTTENLGKITKGTSGTIVHIHNDENFIVEFVINKENIVETISNSKLLSKKLYDWLRFQWQESNHPKYQKYFEEWIYNITFAQKYGFYKSMYAINKKN